MATALITGASAGLGLEFAWQLAAARHDLVLVARDRTRLEDLAEQIRSVAGVRVEVLPADLSVADDVDKVAERLRATERPVGLLVNNAGYAVNRSFLNSSPQAQDDSLSVMVRAVMLLSHAAANQMRTRGRGAILNVSSVAALTAAGTYSAHKAWVLSFTEGLAMDLAGTGVTATALCPGFVHTEFHERAGIDYSSFPEFAWLTAPQVVSAALADVRRAKVISTPSLRYQAASGLLRAMPRWIVRGVQGQRANSPAKPRTTSTHNHP